MPITATAANVKRDRTGEKLVIPLTSLYRAASGRLAARTPWAVPTRPTPAIPHRTFD